MAQANDNFGLQLSPCALIFWVQLAAKCALLVSVLSFYWTGRCFCKSEWSKHDRLHTICSSVIFGAFFFERKGCLGFGLQSSKFLLQLPSTGSIVSQGQRMRTE